MATKNIFSPDSLEAALDLIDKYGSDLLVIAGGTMAMHLINEGLIAPPVALTLHRAQLNEVRAVNGHVEIGATTTFAGGGRAPHRRLGDPEHGDVGGELVRAAPGGGCRRGPPRP
ncbi:MAG: FAD-binding PCMH-type protein [Anaerolineales bacterium]|nr:FAD-binding PCMH-type protein [Anaerolineales bacterium]